MVDYSTVFRQDARINHKKAKNIIYSVFIKIKNFYFSKDTIKKMNGPVTL